MELSRAPRVYPGMRWISLCLFLALAACSHACSDPHPVATPPTAPAAGPLRIASYNVNFGLAGDPRGVAAITGIDADVVFLQETNDRWEAAFVDALGARFAHHRFTAPHELPAGGMGVLSKYPISALDELAAPGAPFFAWRAVVDAPRGKLQVLAVHLRPPMSDDGSWVVGFFSTRQNRLDEITHDLTALDPALPTVILGDFNEDHSGLALGKLRELGYADAVHQFAGDARTWEWPVGGITLRLQLDHIFTDKRLRATGATIVEAGESDHKPIVAVLERL
jgi:vancomycin resistance protein VanJ